MTTDGEQALESWLAAKPPARPMTDPDGPADAEARRHRNDQTNPRRRGRPPAPRTPIIALTANSQVDDRSACGEAGMDGFLVKPLDREKLDQALAGLSGSRSLAA